VDQDFLDLLDLLIEHKARFLVVGAVILLI